MKYIIVSLLCLLFLKGHSQDDLTLEDAIKVGLVQNFDIVIAQKTIEISQNNNTWGQAGRYPSLDVGVQQGNNLSDQRKNPTSFIQQIIRTHSLQGNVTLNWVLFNGFKVKANKEKLQELVNQSEGNASLIVQNTIQAITLAYYNAKLQREKIALLKNVLELSRDKYEYLEIKQELGTALTVDLLQSKTTYLTDSASLVLQKLAFENSVKNLNLLMGVDVKKQWNLISKLSIETPIYDEADLKAKLLSSNQVLKNQMINLELTKQDLKIAKASLYPVISFNARAQNTSTDYHLGQFSQSGATLNYLGNFTLSYRLFDGGKIRRAIKNIEIQKEISNLTIEQSKLQVTQELEVQLANYNSRLALFSIRQQAFEVAKQNLEIAHLKENTGLINSFNLRDIEMAYLRAGVALFDAMYAIIESKTNLAKLTGGLIQEENQ